MSKETMQAFANLVTSVHNETIEVTNSVAKDKARDAFKSGYLRGLQDGRKEKLSEIQRSLEVSLERFELEDLDDMVDRYLDSKFGKAEEPV